MDEIMKYREKLRSRCEKVPIWKKEILSLEEAAEYSGIGKNRLRKLCNAKDSNFAIWNGNTIHIVREKLNRFIEKQTRI